MPITNHKAFPPGSYVIVKCVAATSEFDLTHYMVFKDGEANIYMGTNTVSEPTIGEVSRLSFPLCYPRHEALASRKGLADE